MRAAFKSSRLLQAMLCGAAAIVSCGSARADVVVSTAATSNMNCAGGVCAPTATDAVLNVGDLETLLASGNVTVTTTGSGVQATNIQIVAPLSWATTNTLALDAYQSIAVSKPVSVAGLGGLSITTNDGGSGGFFSFGDKGNATFANLSSPLTINGAAYTLVNNIASLASAIAANPTGDYALANSYNASKDGKYQNSAIPTEFSGTFDGLGNAISNLKLKGTDDGFQPEGLFSELGSGNQPGGEVDNIVVQNIMADGGNLSVGGVVGFNAGTISGSFSSGKVGSTFKHGSAEIGLLVGYNSGTIVRSGAAGAVNGVQNAVIGGLVGINSGPVMQSYADCAIVGGSNSAAGGLIGENVGPIGESYATSSVKGDGNVEFGGLGGFVGDNAAESTITQSYSIGALAGKKSPHRGGLIGADYSPAGSNASTYWDTTTSRVKNLRHGAGNIKNDPGIAGLTTQQFQSSLPQGFDPTVWTENPKINNAFPYLIGNPPRN